MFAAFITGVGLGTGFGVANSLAALTWRPLLGILEADIDFYQKRLYAISKETDPALRKNLEQATAAMIAAEPWCPLSLKFMLYDWMRAQS